MKWEIAVKQRISEVVVRRLKREINQLDEQAGRIPRFCDRIPQPIPLYFGVEEKRLSAAFAEFRAAVKSAIASSRRTEQIARFFAISAKFERRFPPFALGVAAGIKAL